MLELTDEQVSRVARKYCLEMGINPDSTVQATPEPNADGSVNAVLITTTYAKSIEPQVREFVTMMNVLNEVLAEDSF